MLAASGWFSYYSRWDDQLAEKTSFELKWNRRIPELLTLFILIAYTIAARVAHLYISDDSTSYIAASRNLINNGELLVFVNWPSKMLAPQMEPFTEWPPGFPIFMAPFILAFKDTILGASMAQAVAIALYMLAAYFLALRLNLHPILRIASVLTATTLEPFFVMNNSLLSETLFIGLTLLAVALAVRSGHARPAVGGKFLLMLTLFTASWVRFAGAANSVLPLPGFFKGRVFGQDQGHARNPIHGGTSSGWLEWILPAAALIPAPLWLLRNKALYGVFTFTHAPFKQVRHQELFEPAIYVWDVLAGIEGLPAILVLVVVIGLLMHPFFYSASDRRKDQLTLLTVAAFHTLTVWGASLLSSIDHIGHRLMAPSLVVLCIAALHGLDSLIRNLNAWKWRHLLFLIPFVILLADKEIRIRLSTPIHFQMHYPMERALWAELVDQPWAARSTHFYSDRASIHQVFADVPQRIVWDSSLWQDPVELIEMLNKGERPFIVLREGKQELMMFERTIGLARIPLERSRLGQTKYAIYHLP